MKKFISVEKSKLGFIEEWIYNGWKDGYNSYSLVHEYKFNNEYKVAVNTVFHPKKWEISLHPRKGAEKYVKEIMKDKNFNSFSKSKSDIVILDEIDYNENFEEISRKIKSILGIMNELHKENTKTNKL